MAAKQMNIAFITGNYPTPVRPNSGTFVQQFVWAMARQGHACTVINPTSLFDRRFGEYPLREATEDAGGNATVRVLRPRYLSFSSRQLGPFHTGRWTLASVRRRVVKEIERLPTKPDLVYGHFLYDAGRVATIVGRKLGIPSVIGVGEGTFWTVTPYGFKRARADFSATSGFIAVATHIQEGLIVKIGIPVEKIIVQPNGVNLERFKPASKANARSKLGIAHDLFVVAFIGTFDDLKGGAELLEAVKGVNGLGVVMIGSGYKDFISSQMIFKGRVEHHDVPMWLNAADVFVLPTREEGSCNAVIEAMACGLPIVTSDGAYMDDLVDESMAIRVNPTDVKGIRDAIVALRDNADLRESMRVAALAKATAFDLNSRAARVARWMDSLVTNADADYSHKMLD